MDSIRQRFIQAELDFLLVAQSEDQLAELAERWQALQVDWDCCREDADLNTRQLVDEVASKIEELAGDFYFFQTRSVTLEGDLLDSLEEVFSTLTLEDSTNTGTTATSEEAVKTAEPISPSHDIVPPSQWLLRNLHNPYPLPHIQFSGGRTAGSKHLKDWFAKARQRIGWTRLLSDRFAGCRSLAVDAAFRAFIRDDPTNPLDGDLKTAFLAIKSHAELVYSDKEAASPSPSKRLRSVSPTPSLTFSSGSEDSDDEQCPTPSPGNTRKLPQKRASSGSPLRKRRRIHDSPTFPGLPTQAVIPCASEEFPSLCSKKRRFSEDNWGPPCPKRPRGVEGGRSHVVSDPLVLPTVHTPLDFDQSFRIPDPASTSPLDLTTFDLDVFSPATLPTCSTPLTRAPPVDVVAPVADFSALFEIPQLDLLQSGLPSFDSDWTEFLNFQHDLSFFSYSPPFIPSLASTPPLVDDAILLPSPPECDPQSPDPFLNILPRLNEKGVFFSTVGEPLIQEQEFLLPPGESAGIPSTTTLLSLH